MIVNAIRSYFKTDFDLMAHRFINMLAAFLLITPHLQADDYQDAMQLKNKAEKEQASGSLDMAMKMFIEAEELFAKCENAEAEQSLCLYSMCISYFNQRDLYFMRKPMLRLENMARQHLRNKFIQYDYLSVLAAYESAKYEEQPNDSLREQFITHFKQAVAWQSKMTPGEWKKRQINPMLNLMNIAVLYDISYNPPKIDSMQAYINRALAVGKKILSSRDDIYEGKIAAYDLQAWVYLYRKEYALAEQKEKEVLAMIDDLEARRGNAVLTERGEAYAFFVELYKTMGQLDKALEYMELKNEADRKRFDLDKNNAIRHIQAQYETKKKDEHISHLHQRNIALTVIVTLLLSVIAALVAFFIYRRKLREQELYSEALAAEFEASARHFSVKLLADQLGIGGIDLDEAHQLMERAVKPLSVVDQKYILCFLNGEDVKTIARRFNVEPASVYTVRYRMKKKFPDAVHLPF